MVFLKNVNSEEKKQQKNFCELETCRDTREGENELTRCGGCYPSKTHQCEYVWCVRCLQTSSQLIFTDTLYSKYF